MPEQLNIEELPAGPTEGGGGGFRWPTRPGIAELPAGPPWVFTQEAVTELFRLRDRVHALESQALASKVFGGGVSDGKIPPWRLSELPPFEALARTTTFSGELRGPDYGWNQLVGLLQALLAALQKVNPPPNPGELKP
jgi:hypothetical protein